MKTFHCTACHALVFFENTHCLQCGKTLAFIPQRLDVVALAPVDGTTVSPVRRDGSVEPAMYKLCVNYTEANICNWTLPADDPEALCQSCRLTHTIPNLAAAGDREAWAKLETAKRRLIYALIGLGLPHLSKREQPETGLEFNFLSDFVTANGDRGRVLTGHDNGVITINIAEADDVYRETQRHEHREPYRTLLGHFRHEIGHYYWDRLVQGGERLDEFRRLFGDERADYAAALERHYNDGPPADWADHYISAYATMHPWEDWAEVWAHVLHMVDALETAHFVGLAVHPRSDDEPTLDVPVKPSVTRVGDFDRLVMEWATLTYVLNNLTRGLGLADAYPFVLSSPVVDKLRFVCKTMAGAAMR